MTLRRELGVVSSTFVVIASRIGMGIFVTTGIILDMTKSPEVVLLLWGVAGAIAVAGALCYAELAAMMPHVGGGYIYLKRTFGLLPASLTGWISLVVGFTASIAVSSVTLVHYLKEFLSTYYPGWSAADAVRNSQGRHLHFPRVDESTDDARVSRWCPSSG